MFTYRGPMVEVLFLLISSTDDLLKRHDGPARSNGNLPEHTRLGSVRLIAGFPGICTLARPPGWDTRV